MKIDAWTFAATVTLSCLLASIISAAFRQWGVAQVLAVPAFVAVLAMFALLPTQSGR